MLPQFTNHPSLSGDDCLGHLVSRWLLDSGARARVMEFTERSSLFSMNKPKSRCWARGNPRTVGQAVASMQGLMGTSIDRPSRKPYRKVSYGNILQSKEEIEKQFFQRASWELLEMIMYSDINTITEGREQAVIAKTDSLPWESATSILMRDKQMLTQISQLVRTYCRNIRIIRTPVAIAPLSCSVIGRVSLHLPTLPEDIERGIVRMDELHRELDRHAYFMTQRSAVHIGPGMAPPGRSIPSVDVQPYSTDTPCGTLRLPDAFSSLTVPVSHDLSFFCRGPAGNHIQRAMAEYAELAGSLCRKVIELDSLSADADDHVECWTKIRGALTGSEMSPTASHQDSFTQGFQKLDNGALAWVFGSVEPWLDGIPAKRPLIGGNCRQSLDSIISEWILDTPSGVPLNDARGPLVPPLSECTRSYISTCGISCLTEDLGLHIDDSIDPINHKQQDGRSPRSPFESPPGSPRPYLQRSASPPPHVRKLASDSSDGILSDYNSDILCDSDSDDDGGAELDYSAPWRAAGSDFGGISDSAANAWQENIMKCKEYLCSQLPGKKASITTISTDSDALILRIAYSHSDDRKTQIKKAPGGRRKTTELTRGTSTPGPNTEITALELMSTILDASPKQSAHIIGQTGGTPSLVKTATSIVDYFQGSLRSILWGAQECPNLQSLSRVSYNKANQQEQSHLRGRSVFADCLSGLASICVCPRSPTLGTYHGVAEQLTSEVMFSAVEDKQFPITISGSRSRDIISGSEKRVTPDLPSISAFFGDTDCTISSLESLPFAVDYCSTCAVIFITKVLSFQP